MTSLSSKSTFVANEQSRLSRHNKPVTFNNETVKSVNETNCELITRSKFNAREEDNTNQYNITSFTRDALLKNIRVDFKS